MESSSYLSLMLLAIGLALLIAEIFIPSGGIILFVSLLCLGGSVWFAWDAWWASNRSYWWMYLASLVVLLPTTVCIAFYIFPKTPIGKRILLEAPPLAELTPYAEEETHFRGFIGRQGKTLTLLMPGGMVLVEDERVHCESEGMSIEPGETVDVVAVKGNRLVVRLSVSDNETAWIQEEGENKADGGTDDRPLDFDLPQS